MARLLSRWGLVGVSYPTQQGKSIPKTLPNQSRTGGPMPWGRPEHFIWCRRSAEWKRGEVVLLPPAPPGRRLGEKPGGWPGCGHPASAGRRNAPPALALGPVGGDVEVFPLDIALQLLHQSLGQQVACIAVSHVGRLLGKGFRRAKPAAGRDGRSLPARVAPHWLCREPHLVAPAWIHVLSRRAGVSPPRGDDVHPRPKGSERTTCPPENRPCRRGTAPEDCHAGQEAVFGHPGASFHRQQGAVGPFQGWW